MNFTAFWVGPGREFRHGKQSVLFRRSFALSSVPARCELLVSADTLFKLYINGRYAGNGPLKVTEY